MSDERFIKELVEQGEIEIASTIDRGIYEAYFLNRSSAWYAKELRAIADELDRRRTNTPRQAAKRFLEGDTTPTL